MIHIHTGTQRGRERWLHSGGGPERSPRALRSSPPICHPLISHLPQSVVSLAPLGLISGMLACVHPPPHLFVDVGPASTGSMSSPFCLFSVCWLYILSHPSACTTSADAMCIATHLPKYLYPCSLLCLSLSLTSLWLICIFILFSCTITLEDGVLKR